MSTRFDELFDQQINAINDLPTIDEEGPLDEHGLPIVMPSNDELQSNDQLQSNDEVVQWSDLPMEMWFIIFSFLSPTRMVILCKMNFPYAHYFVKEHCCTTYYNLSVCWRKWKNCYHCMKTFEGKKHLNVNFFELEVPQWPILRDGLLSTCTSPVNFVTHYMCDIMRNSNCECCTLMFCRHSHCCRSSRCISECSSVCEEWAKNPRKRRRFDLLTCNSRCDREYFKGFN